MYPAEPSSLSAWEKEVAALRECLEERTEYALRYLQREFGFSDEQMEEWTQKALAAQGEEDLA